MQPQINPGVLSTFLDSMKKVLKDIVERVTGVTFRYFVKFEP